MSEVEEKKRVLIITQEMKPYTALSEISEIARKLPQYIQDSGMDVRVLMPRFGTINERRHRLHEVVRLSGMNIVVDDEDYPLIIKVASLPGARMQVYFLDNEEFFKRKQIFEDAQGELFEDNLDRMIFFAKASIETIQRMGWKPDVIHCHGWMTTIVPSYIRTIFKEDPMFDNVKLVYSLYDYDLEGTKFNQEFLDKAGYEEEEDNSFLEIYKGEEEGPLALHTGAAKHSDGVIIASEYFEEEEIVEEIEALDIKTLDYKNEEEYLPAYINFYKELLNN